MRRVIEKLRQSNPVLLVGLFSLLFLIFFHNATWHHGDDGVFAYIADQLVQGAVFGVDIYDIHGGYQNILNAALFSVFGADVAVLRYPLLALGVLQAMMATHLCRRQGWSVSVVVGLATTLLSYGVFFSPAPNWYALFFAFTAVWILSVMKASWQRAVLLGVVVGLCFMFRHPSAIFLSFGILSYLLYESGRWVAVGRQYFAQFIILLVALGLLIYLGLLFEPVAFLVLGGWAFVLLWYLWRGRYGIDRLVVPQFVGLGAGFVAALLPMVWYQFTHNNLWQWFEMSFFSSTSILSSSYIASVRYWHIYRDFIFELTAVVSPAQLLFSAGVVLALASLGVYAWQRRTLPVVRQVVPFCIAGVGLVAYVTVLLSMPAIATFFTERLGEIVVLRLAVTMLLYTSFLLVPVLYGWLLLTKVSRRQKLPVAVFVAGFYAYVALYAQVWLYIFFMLPLLLVAFVQLADWSQIQKRVFIGITATALLFNFLASGRLLVIMQDPSTLPRASVVMLPSIEWTYERMQEEIEHYAPSDKGLYVFPWTPELYFINRKTAPVPFPHSNFYLDQEANYLRTYAAIRDEGVTLVVQDVKPPYVGAYDLILLSRLLEEGLFHYVGSVGRFNLYARGASPAGDGVLPTQCVTMPPLTEAE